MVMNRSSWLAGLLFLGSACDANVEHKPALYPDQTSASFELFVKQCSSCHQPPMPDAHLAKAWPAVVERMQQHKQQQGFWVMNAVEKKQVLQYLQSHAKQGTKNAN
ncbi:MAG: hypothetical protein R8K49_07795 [Mariprofundaceae bacterium]